MEESRTLNHSPTPSPPSIVVDANSLNVREANQAAHTNYLSTFNALGFELLESVANQSSIDIESELLPSAQKTNYLSTFKGLELQESVEHQSSIDSESELLPSVQKTNYLSTFKGGLQESATEHQSSIDSESELLPSVQKTNYLSTFKGGLQESAAEHQSSIDSESELSPSVQTTNYSSTFKGGLQESAAHQSSIDSKSQLSPSVQTNYSSTFKGLQESKAHPSSESTHEGLQTTKYSSTFTTAENKVTTTTQTAKVDPEDRFYRSFLGVTRLPRGQIKIGKKLGQGAFGEVYQGQWGEKAVALKKLDMAHAKESFPELAQEHIEEALQWEIARLSTASHPNIVPFYGIYQEQAEGHTYIVMAFCHGGTLEHALKKEEVSWSTRWRWAIELSQGLVYLHEKGMIHRDLKAENILIDRHGCAKLADLGVSQADALLADREAKVVAEGLQDQRFIAPENLMARTLSNAKTDMYALGLVFWQLVSAKVGKPCPVPRAPAQLSKEYKTAWYRGQFTERERIPTDCPPEFKAVIMACWKREPQQRPTALQVLGTLYKYSNQTGQLNPLVYACEQVDWLIHPKRLEGLRYIYPYVTLQRVTESIERYWAGIEGVKKTSAQDNPPLELKPQLAKFIADPKARSLLLLGDSGLGKTLTTYLFADDLLEQWRGYLKDPQNVSPPPYLPIFVRPALAHWSQAELQGSFQRVLKYYGLNVTGNNSWGLLLILDGYDECQGAQAFEGNSGEHLGIPGDAKVKVLTTCRPDTVPAHELSRRFGWDNTLQVEYFLPFKLEQMLTYLEGELSWDERTRQDYENQLQSANELRAVLRTPFVLQLFVQSFESLPQGQELNRLNRRQIYQSAVAHWLHTQHGLLPKAVQEHLAEAANGDEKTLIASFKQFAQSVAFEAFLQNRVSATRAQVDARQSPWSDLKTHVEKESEVAFKSYDVQLIRFPQKREDSTEKALYYCKEKTLRVPAFIQWEGEQYDWYGLNAKGEPQLTPVSLGDGLTSEEVKSLPFSQAGEKTLRVSETAHAALYQAIEQGQVHVKNAERRRLLTQADYSRLLQERCQQFEASSPLSYRLTGYEFSHKSLLEYFVAERLAGTMVTNCPTPFAPGEDWNQRSIVKEEAILRFLADRLHEEPEHYFERVEALFQWVECSRHHPEGSIMAANAMTLLNYLKVSFSQRDLHGVQIQGANLERAICGYTDFSGANLRGVNLRRAYLVQADLTNADLVEVTFGEYPNLKLNGEIHCIAYSRDQRYLAVANGTDIQLFIDIDGNGSFELLGEPLKHADRVYSVAFSPDGKTLASGSLDCTVRLWDSATQKPLGEPLKGHQNWVYSVAFSPDGKILASGSLDHTVQLWDSATQQPLGEPLKGHQSSVYSVDFSPDGKILASGSGDSTVRLWDSATQKPLDEPLKGHQNFVTSVAFSPDGKTLASGSVDKTVRLWDSATQKPLGEPLKGHQNYVNSVAFSPDGKTLASGSEDKTVRLWDSTTQKLLGEPLTGHRERVMSVAFSPDGKTLASGSYDRTVRFWDITTQKPLDEPLTGHQSSVYSVAFSPDGKILASSSADSTVRLWDSATLKPLGEPLTGHGEGVTSVAFSPDGKTLASSSTDCTVWLWDSVTQKPIGEPLTGHQGEVRSVAFSPDGKTLASGSEDETVWLWDSATQQPLGEPLTGHGEGVNSVAFSPDGKTLASSSTDSTVRLWDSATQQPLGEPLTGHGEGVNSVAFSPDGKTLASSSADSTVQLWDSATLKPLGEPLTGHSGWVYSVAFSPDGKTLASSSTDCTVRLWDRITQKPLGNPLTGHQREVKSVAFSPDGKTLASGSYDHSIGIWVQVETTAQDAGFWTLQYRLGAEKVVLTAQGAYLKGAKLSPVNQELLRQRKAKLDEAPNRQYPTEQRVQ